jgi:hypothetical protein
MAPYSPRDLKIKINGCKLVEKRRHFIVHNSDTQYRHTIVVQCHAENIERYKEFSISL